MIKTIWEKIKRYLNPFLLVIVAFVVGIVYGLTQWEPILWLLMAVIVPLVIGFAAALVYVMFIIPIQWLIKKFKK